METWRGKGGGGITVGKGDGKRGLGVEYPANPGNRKCDWELHCF